ncbi:MAG: histidine phosphatase family protein [Clostridia bacterium]|nr:histidine phosphatase family protein [Clostridia bacterium]
MSTKIIMVRHGFSLANEAKKFAGHWDIDLTELGKKQAEMAGKYFKSHPVDAIYSSDLLRAYHTALPIGEALGLPVHKEIGLREIKAGEWEQIGFDDMANRYPKESAVWVEDIGRSGCPGGETVKELSARIVSTVRRIAERHDGQTVCITTHATPIRAVSTEAAGIPVEEMKNIPWAANASLNVFEYENGRFKAIELDIVEHLGDLLTQLPANV